MSDTPGPHALSAPSLAGTGTGAGPGAAARAIAAGVLATVSSWSGAQPDLDVLARQVADTERAFARTMAERDHGAFTALLSEQALFFDGPQVLRGKAAVAAGWKSLFDGPVAPFSWQPDQVQVLADGTLALSTGPVRNAQGQPIARFNSIWRQEAPGVWRIVFDKGQPADPAPR
jgi:ketosteroid isomerase-like protein